MSGQNDAIHICKQESTVSTLQSRIAVIETHLGNITEIQREIRIQLKSMEDNCHNKEISRNKSLSDMSGAASNASRLIQQLSDQIKDVIHSMQEMDEELNEQDKIITSLEKDFGLLSEKFSKRSDMCDSEIFCILRKRITKLERLERTTQVIASIFTALLFIITAIKLLPAVAKIIVKLLGT